MRIEGTFLRGGVARRIFALFVLSAFLPMMVMAVLTYSQVRGIIAEQTRYRLVDTCKDFAMSVHQRLQLMQGSLARNALDIHDDHLMPAKSVLASLSDLFARLTLIQAGARTTPLIGDALALPDIGETERAHLAKGETVLFAQPDPGKSPRILLLHMVHADDPDSTTLIAEVNPAQIWGGEEDFAYMTGLCMFDDTGAMLFCSKPELETQAATLTRKIAEYPRDPQVQIGDEPWILGQWQLFLKPKFHASHWTAVAAQPTAIGLIQAEKFSRVFIGVIVLALLLAALLSVGQIRRTMGPLEKLINGTRRVADGNFDRPVEVAGHDEFGELSASFNDMAGRLGSQLETLKVLSNIDQVILSKLDIDPVFNLVLQRVRKLTSASFAGIVVLEKSAAEEARVYLLQAGEDMQTGRIRVYPESLQQFAARDKGFWLDDAASLRDYIHEPGFKLAGPLFILPILAEGALSAFFCLEFKTAGDLAPHLLIHLRDLGDRVGVALSAVAHDENLIYQARHDDLTGLPNRLLFKERLSSEISYARREARIMALLFIDLDRFKIINDTLGHSAGDQLLHEAAQRLRRCSREGDTVARLGGDEFAVILPAIPTIRSATKVAEHILQAFLRPFMLAGQENHISASIGIAISPADGRDSEELLRNADTAMYRAKALGRGRFVYFEERMNVEATEHMNLEREMRQGLPRKEFVLVYQPKLDLLTGRIGGAEALLRWHHPTRGLVAPDAFIGVAEDTGLIEELGKNVIWDACSQHAAWRAAGVYAPRIAVNVSGRQFRRGDLIQVVSEALQATSTPPGALEIEVTESLFMDDTCDVTSVLKELRQMGLKVTIDDFGTGYSSMSYLRWLPMDCIKVDKSFVDDMVDDENARAIAEVIIRLAHTLGKSVVAEGVQNAGQLNLLREWQCDTIQGYYFSTPLTPGQYVEFIKSYNTEGIPL